MNLRSALAVGLAAIMAVPAPVWAGPASGTVTGTVTVDGRPLDGLDLSLVDLESGAVHKARSKSGGTFELELAPGTYVVTGGGGIGLSVGRAPAVVRVESGKVASTSVELVAMAAAAAVQAGGSGATIQHDAIGCVVAGEFPMLDAVIEPASSVVRARLYFRSSLSEEWYFTEMVLQPTGGFRGWMPRPQVAASPITYYLQATTTDFGETQTPEIQVIVVEDEFDCGDKVVAATGQPPAGLTVFSASTGAAAIPVGFAAGGALLGTGALIALGALLLGGGLAVLPGPSPTATPTPTATPIPPTPTPTPIPPVSLILRSELVPPNDSDPRFRTSLGEMIVSRDGSGRLEVPASGNAQGSATVRRPTAEEPQTTAQVTTSVFFSASPAGLNVGPLLNPGPVGVLFIGWGDDCGCGAGSPRLPEYRCSVTFDYVPGAPGEVDREEKTCTTLWSFQQYDQDGPTIPPFP